MKFLDRKSPETPPPKHAKENPEPRSEFSYFLE